MRAHFSSKFLLFTIILFSVNLACNFQGLGRQELRDTIPVSTEAVKNLQEEIGDALDKIASGNHDITIMIDEVELTSLVTFELQNMQEPQILEPQIYLREGQIQIFASLIQGNINTPIQMAVSVAADASGYPYYQITSAMMGPIPLPVPMLDQIKSMLDDVLSEKIRSQTNQFFIRSIEILDGVMTIQGEAR